MPTGEFIAYSIKIGLRLALTSHSFTEDVDESATSRSQATAKTRTRTLRDEPTRAAVALIEKQQAGTGGSLFRSRDAVDIRCPYNRLQMRRRKEW